MRYFEGGWEIPNTFAQLLTPDCFHAQPQDFSPHQARIAWLPAAGVVSLPLLGVTEVPQNQPVGTRSYNLRSSPLQLLAAEGAAEAPKAIKPTAADYLNPKPSTLYESNGYYYQTDANGKLTEVSGDLRLGKGARNPYQQAKVGRSSGVVGDEGGHMAGAQFDALGEGPLHLVPQAMKLNRGAGSAWSAMEREWADAVSAGNKVSFKTNIDWPAGASRPTKFRVQYTVTSPSGSSQTFVRTFLNQ